MTTQEIKQAVHDAIPLNTTCEQVRRAQIEARVAVRVLIEEILKDRQPFDPRTQFKNDSTTAT